jgi:membrane associated rhomboid family serine protease
LPIAAVLTIAFFGAWIVALIGVPLVFAARDTRRDRRRILAEGVTVEGTVTAIGPPDSGGVCTVSVAFQPAGSSGRFVLEQSAASETLELAGLAVGASTQIHYLQKTPRAALVDALMLAERLTPDSEARTLTGASGPAVFFISFTDPANSHYAPGSPTNSYRWLGPGDVAFRGQSVHFVAKRRRAFRWPAIVNREFALQNIANVEVFGNAVRFEVLERNEPARALQFWAVNAADAEGIAARLPKTRTEAFSPALAEAAEFDRRLRALTPATPATLTLIATNCVVFASAAALGAGIFSPDGEVIARIGSDFTPLTVGGQWWRLLTSTFLHFGLFHLAFNMWALYANGPLAERIFGSARYLLIYLCAGLAGSAASLWWHAVVNGVGASGAIFGVFGAILAFFLRKDGGVPASVLKRHRTSVAAFIGYNLLFGLRSSGIDNAAHIGGLIAGFLLGLALTRPLDEQRAEPARDYRWAVALAVVTCAGLLFSYIRSPTTDALLAQMQSANRPDTTKEPPPRSPEDASSGRSGNRTAVAPTDRPAAPPAALATTFWGVSLGETRANVERTKGKPVRIERGASLYNAAGPGGDGLIEVSYRKSGQTERDTVAAIFYLGDRASAPTELPFIIGTTGEALLETYHLPIWTSVPDTDSEFEMFSTGLTAYLWHREVKRYGIQDYYREP